MPDKGYHISQCDRIVELIECYIIENNLKPLDKLPSERKLCKMWDCNRMTLRSAISCLEREGKIFSVHGSGNYIAEKKFNMDLMEIKSFFSRVKEMGHIQRNKLISINKIECSKKLSKILTIEIGSPVYEIERLRYIDETPVMLESSYIPCMLCPGIEKYNFENESLYDILSNQYGLELTNGDIGISVTNAEPFEAELLEIPEKQPMFFVTIKTCSSDETPIEYAKAIVRSDKVQFTSKLE